MSQKLAHKEIIEKYLNWDLVKKRLDNYPYINCQYSIDTLMSCRDISPYHCHYLAWGLGTWQNETMFSNFDTLLKHAMSLQNWNKHKSSISDKKFPEFWSLLWELQVAKFFSDLTNKNVEWTTSGPDLKINFNGQELYVECYVYHKSFGIMKFIEELLNKIEVVEKGNRNVTVHDIHVHHSFYLPINILKKDEPKLIDAFLNEIFTPFLDEEYIEKKRQEAEKKYPVILFKNSDKDNFCIYLEGDNPDRFEPNIIPSGAGIPEFYLEVAIKEAINNKRKRNLLSKHHPNLLAINFLLSEDFQDAINRQFSIGGSIPCPDLGDTLDAVLLSTCGINEIFSIKPRLVYINPAIS